VTRHEKICSAALDASCAAQKNNKLTGIGISKLYADFAALHPTDINIARGELITLLGPSGSGKTTLLQLISGLVKPSAGKIFIDDIDNTELAAYKRDIGVVFQNYCLFPHLTVEENIAFPLEMRRRPRAEASKRIADVLEMIGLGAYGHRFPHELSGGQAQRVALARCLVYRPSLILMDEPLSALDRALRETMQVEIKKIHRDTGSTIIFVTHDQEEALALSDRVCLMKSGRIEQMGTPLELYDQPRTVFAAGFIGISNIVKGRLIDGNKLLSDIGDTPIQLGTPAAVDAGDTLSISIRPEALKLGTPGTGFADGQVIEQIYAGPETRILIKLRDGSVFTARSPAGSSARELGEIVSLKWREDSARALAP
jgi:putative spermidine/putrescine transport system ATP-binding protein